MTLDAVVSLLSVGTREILRRIETDEVHALDAPNGQMLVCVKSLAREETNPQSNTKET